MNCGMNNVVGFLNNDKCKSYLDNLKISSLSIGQVISCAVLSVNDNVIQLSAGSNDLINIRVKDNVRGKFPSSCLLPGLNVKAKIVDIQDSGLEILLFDEFQGSKSVEDNQYFCLIF